MILNRSTVGNKSSLAHVIFFKLKRKLTSIIAKDLKSESLNENHLVTAHTSTNMIRGTWLDVSFSSHVKKVIRAIWLAFNYLDQLVNENLFCTFSVGKSQCVYNKVWNVTFVVRFEGSKHTTKIPKKRFICNVTIVIVSFKVKDPVQLTEKYTKKRSFKVDIISLLPLESISDLICCKYYQ